MQQRKSKKILIYFFLLLIVGSINNINLNTLELQNINTINIVGLEFEDKSSLHQNIKNLNSNNIFSVSKIDLINEIESNAIIEKYSIFKKYPSSLDFNIKKTKFLARINKNGKIFYIGSNGKFIKNDFLNNQLPFIFGSPTVDEFFRIKKIIDESKISYAEIKNLFFFPSKRWDLELRDNTLIKLPHDNVNIALNLAMEFFDDNKLSLKLTSNFAKYLASSNSATLYENLLGKTFEGYSFSAVSANMNLDTNFTFFEGPIIGSNQGVVFEAGQMEIQEKGDKIFFSSGVKVKILSGLLEEKEN